MLEFRKINIKTIDDFRYIEKWDKSEDAYLFIPNFEETDKLKSPSAEEMWRKHDVKTRRSYMIELNGEVVGKVDYILDSPVLYKKEIKSAWLSLVIGEKSARGRGIGKKSLEFIENKIKEENISRIELGVFEFNERAINLYKKNDYKKISVIEKITFYNGSWKNDIRMEKEV